MRKWMLAPLKEGWKDAPNLWKKNIKNDLSPINEDGMWKTYINELCTLYDELDIVKVIKLGRLRWLGHLFRMWILAES